jgi:hypothetical protein
MMMDQKKVSSSYDAKNNDRRNQKGKKKSPQKTVQPEL